MASHAQNDLNRARELLLAGDTSRALALYQKLTRLCPGTALVWYECGNAAFKSRQMDFADRAWTKAIDLEPRNAELIGMIGHQFEALRRPEKARACFVRAAAAEPRGINARISLAVLLEKSHCLDQARAAVAECLAIEPLDDQARYFSALLDRREGKLQEAENHLRDLIASKPKHPFVRYAARYELAQVMDRTDRFDEAMSLLVAAKDIVRALADTGLLMRSYDQKAESARRFTSSQPNDILRNLGKILSRAKARGHPASGLSGRPSPQRHHSAGANPRLSPRRGGAG